MFTAGHAGGSQPEPPFRRYRLRRSRAWSGRVIHVFGDTACDDHALCTDPLDDIAEAFPCLAVPALQLQPLDRPVVRLAGIDQDARQQGLDLEVMQALRLWHDVVPRE